MSSVGCFPLDNGLADDAASARSCTRGFGHDGSDTASAHAAGRRVGGTVTYDRLLHADREPHNWLSYSGNYAGHRYSPLSQINRTNVKNLQLKWSYHPLYAKNGNTQNKMENTPLVVDGIMYTGTALEAVALDAVTGRQFWKLTRAARSQGVLQRLRSQQGHGDRRRHSVLGDCRLPPARDRREDRPRDLGQDARRLQARATNTTLPPLIVRNMVILGPATNEAGANCWVSAYDVKTGKELWRFDTARRPRTTRQRRPGWATRGSTAAARSGTPAATIRKPI